MTLIRSILFDIFYVADTVVACLLGLALFWTKKRKFVLSRVFSVPTIWMMKHLVGLELRVEGLENLPKDKKYIVASKHESALETIAFHYILPVPAYILKKELMYLPLFGWALAMMNSVPIDRSSGGKAMRKMLAGTKENLANERPVVIFPEGTRMKPLAPTKYNPGVAFLYEKCDVPVVPVALNSGYFWGKNSFIKKKGTVIIRFLEPIAPGMERRAFLAELEKRIETACRDLVPPEVSE